MRWRRGRLEIQAEHTDMVDLATMCGALQQFVGVEAYKRGRSLDEVKDAMLDIHLAAMDALTEESIRQAVAAGQRRD